MRYSAINQSGMSSLSSASLRLWHDWFETFLPLRTRKAFDNNNWKYEVRCVYVSSRAMGRFSSHGTNYRLSSLASNYLALKLQLHRTLIAYDLVATYSWGTAWKEKKTSQTGPGYVCRASRIYLSPSGSHSASASHNCCVLFCWSVVPHGVRMGQQCMNVSLGVPGPLCTPRAVCDCGQVGLACSQAKVCTSPPYNLP